MNYDWINILIHVVKMLVVFGALMMAAAYSTLAERRFAGFIQDRLGPNRTGPEGLLQPFADFIKLFFKEEFLPASVDKWMFRAAPAVMVFPALVLFAVIPFGDTITIYGREIRLQLANLDFGILYLFAIASLGVYGIVIGAWASNNKYSLFGGIRASAQMISYEIAMGLSVISILMMTNSLKLDEVVLSQTQMIGGFIPSWNFWRQPLMCIVFMVAAFAETNRTPFDLPEAEQELVGGYHTEFSSVKFSFFFLAEYLNLVISSALIVTLFFGGWHLPWVDKIGMPAWLLALLQVMSFAVKTAFMVFVYIWVRWTVPRFKYNQVMNIGWKALVPLALANVVVTGIVMYLF